MIEVREAKTRREQKDFLNFPLDLYKGCNNYIPPLYMDEKKIFRKDYLYNDNCDSVYYNAYKDGVMSGRIQGIIQKDANAKNNEKRCRFTRYEVIDDIEVSKALFAAAEKWALEKGMDTIVGPLGFSDLEKEGMLIDGFDVPSSFEITYNYPYYQKHIEALGYQKEIDYTSTFLYGPESEQTMADMDKLVDYIFKRYNLHFGEARNGKDFLNKYATKIFDLIDKSYEGLYGCVPFTDGMRKQVIDNFSLVISPKYSAVILDENDRAVCFGMAVPSLNDALAGTRGHLTPGVLIRLLKCIRKPNIIDMCLIGVDPEYMNRGISAALSVGIMHMLTDNPHIKHADSLLNLENNYAILNQWKRFNRDVKRRLRCYVKPLV